MNKLCVNEIAVGLLRAIAAIVMGSVLGALLFAGIDWMRTFQSDTIVTSVSRAALHTEGLDEAAQPVLLALIAQFVDWYSTTFFGYARFGAGLFMLAAGCWAMGESKAYSLFPRIVIGFVVGAAMGTRVAMFVLSRPILVLSFALIGGVLGAFYLMMVGRPSQFDAIPKLQFKHQS